MHSHDLAKLHAFEDIFAGPTGLVGERATALYDAEKHHRETAIDQWSIWTRTVDAFFDFYIQTLTDSKCVGSAVLSACFISSFWRLRSSHALLFDGYYEDASALLRAVWENVRHLAAVRGGTIKIEDIWDMGFGFAAMSPEDRKKREKAQRSRFEQKIEDYHAALLDPQEWKYLKTAYEVTHKDVHRSELAMLSLVSAWQQGMGMRLFPAYDKNAASRVVNLTVFLMWATTRLLHHFYNGGVPSSDWEKRFSALDAHFAWQLSGMKSVLPRLESCFMHYIEKVMPL
jgi:hypothetical protein